MRGMSPTDPTIVELYSFPTSLRLVVRSGCPKQCSHSSSEAGDKLYTATWLLGLLRRDGSRMEARLPFWYAVGTLRHVKE